MCRPVFNSKSTICLFLLLMYCRFSSRLTSSDSTDNVNPVMAFDIAKPTLVAKFYLEREVQSEMSRLMSLEYDVARHDLYPFISLINIIKSKYAQQPEIYKVLLAMLHQYEPKDGIQAYQKLVTNMEILLSANPELYEALIPLIPEPITQEPSYSIKENQQNTKAALHALPVNSLPSTPTSTMPMIRQTKSAEIIRPQTTETLNKRSTKESIKFYNFTTPAVNAYLATQGIPNRITNTITIPTFHLTIPSKENAQDPSTSASEALLALASGQPQGPASYGIPQIVWNDKSCTNSVNESTSPFPKDSIVISPIQLKKKQFLEHREKILGDIKNNQEKKKATSHKDVDHLDTENFRENSPEKFEINTTIKQSPTFKQKVSMPQQQEMEQVNSFFNHPNKSVHSDTTDSDTSVDCIAESSNMAIKEDGNTTVEANGNQNNSYIYLNSQKVIVNFAKTLQNDKVSWGTSHRSLKKKGSTIMGKYKKKRM